MEPPAKRPRMGVRSHLTNILSHDDDELNFDPEEVSQRRDPGYQLQQERSFAANRLKSTFEHIFEKYERDFSEIGDEIDLRTGEIVVNNGHLYAMRNEKDVGDDVDEDEGMLLSEMYVSDSENDGADDDADNEEDVQLDEDAEEDRILQGRSATPKQAQAVKPASRNALSASRNVPVPTPIRLATQNRLASLSLSRYTPQKPSPLSSGAWEIDESLMDPVWRAPPLVQASLPALHTPARDALYQLPATNGARSVWTSGSSNMEWPSGGYVPRARGPLAYSSPTPKLMAPRPEVDDDEDEILMGGPVKTTVKRSGFASSGAITEVEKPAPDSSPLPQSKGRPNKKQKNGVASKRQTKSVSSKDPRTPDSTRKELSSKPRQKFIVAIPFRKPPTPESLTMVDDTSPRSGRTRRDSATPVPEETMPNSPARTTRIETHAPIQDAQQPLSVSSASPRPPTPRILPETTASAPEEDASSAEQQNQQPPPVELFSRNEIDPSYEFSDEDDLPPRKPVEAVTSALSEAAPTVAVEIDMPRAAESTTKRMLRRSKALKEQKQPPDDHLPPSTEARSPSSPSRPQTEKQRNHSPVEATFRGDEGGTISAEDEELPELENMLDVQDFTDAQELADVLELPDAPDLAPLEDLLPLLDNPEAEAPSQHAEPPEMPEEPDTTSVSDKRLRNLNLIAPIEADVPSPVRSDDSLGLALDAVIASQGLFDDFDGNPDSSPAKPVEESPTSYAPAPRSSTRKRSRSVHFLEGEVRDDSDKTRIVSTPPLRRASSQYEEAIAPEVQEAPSSPQDAVPEPPPQVSDAIDLTSAPDPLPPSPAGGMFSARRARRRKGASLSSSPAPVVSPAIKKPAMRRPAFKRVAAKEPVTKRRSLLSIALADSDDEDPLNAMSLLTTWTAGVAWSPRGAVSTPPGSNKRAGGGSTTRKRIAREGFGGLSTPTKRTGILAASSPSGSVICTPGGHARRCGVDGFRCNRDFCFTCLDG